MASSSPTASYSYVFRASIGGGSDGPPWDGAILYADVSAQSFRVRRIRDLTATPGTYQIITLPISGYGWVACDGTFADQIVGIESLAASATGTSYANPIRLGAAAR